MQSAVILDGEIISLTYKFAYRLCGDRRIAEKLTEISLTAHYQDQDNSILVLKGVWQEFKKYYSFIEFKEGSGVQRILLSLPAEIRCSVILKDVFKYDYPQIANILSITPKEVQKIVAQGRQGVVTARKMLTK